jgi:hypothetical protein
MTSVDERFQEVMNSDQSLEDFYRGIFDPLLQTGVWETSGDYSQRIDHLARMRRIDELPEDKAREEIERLQNEGMHVNTSVRQVDGNAELSWEEEGDYLLKGHLNYNPEDIDNQKQAEEGSLLWELRRTYEDIASQHTTEYLEPQQLIDNPDVEDPGWIERPLKIQVPADYDTATYQETAEELAAAAREIQNVHDSMEALVRGYRDE